MTHDVLNAISVAWLAIVLAWLWMLAWTSTEDRRRRICRRRGCRRSPAGQGCNHAAACEGSRARHFTPEED